METGPGAGGVCGDWLALVLEGFVLCYYRRKSVGALLVSKAWIISIRILPATAAWTLLHNSNCELLLPQLL